MRLEPGGLHRLLHWAHAGPEHRLVGNQKRLAVQPGVTRLVAEVLNDPAAHKDPVIAL
jgi:hypothetical protein